MGPNIFVRLIPLPCSVRAAVLPNEDGTFDIYINAALPEELQHRALAHELSHIRRDHFYQDAPVTHAETEANLDTPA